MSLAIPSFDELAALRKLEAAVRACGLPHVMVSGGPQLETLAAALKAIEDARRSSADTVNSGNGIAG